ncbi:hypothetical protein MUY27_18690 [Mucilaginibacter sp. RS28]|uniref:Uncharacterized protein n=1 Tax=Mucilaginibacter straminoryzae TaxID=2932774 RepID=A0A9X1X8N0_9SPHI|nr:hypothetical protein [Mucilaginibacter straminoryzae]MCJ8211753.1 hypothetical protein [Mucilaginibacter straminoryzae]
MSKKIDKALAKRMIQGYKKQNNGHSTTRAGQKLSGFLVDRASLEEILKHPDNYDGIHFYIAKHHEHVDKNDNVIAMVFAGAKRNPKYAGADGKGDPGEPPYTNGDPYDHSDSCPDNCGDLPY